MEKREYAKAAVVCFSHLRWNFVYQRPQHLLARCQKIVDVHLWEEPILQSRALPGLTKVVSSDGVRVVTPLLPRHLSNEDIVRAQRELLDGYLADEGLSNFIAWYYTPMALPFSDHLSPHATIYDCMDELSAFQGAPPELVEQEGRLFARADVVFAGGASLYASKRRRHPNVHLLPSSIDRSHFAIARAPQEDPIDQASIPHPRIGFFGVLDERLDRELLREIAELRPDWHFVLIGPVVKINECDLPRAANLHYLGQKSYADLPAYLANWDVAMLPFAQNESTRFISPTKTPEYLAAGKPVVSTPIRDVVNPYGDMKLVQIAASATEFASAIEVCLGPKDAGWLAKVDRFLAGTSWDKTFEAMWKEIQRCGSQSGANSGTKAAGLGTKKESRRSLANV